MDSRQLSIIFNWNSTNLCKYFPSPWWIWCLGWAEGVVHLLQKGIPYLQNSISQSLLEDFFLFCTVVLYSAVRSPQVVRQGAGARIQTWFREGQWWAEFAGIDYPGTPENRVSSWRSVSRSPVASCSACTVDDPQYSVSNLDWRNIQPHASV